MSWGGLGYGGRRRCGREKIDLWRDRELIKELADTYRRGVQLKTNLSAFVETCLVRPEYLPHLSLGWP